MERLQENIIKTSVRNLVEFILRSGDIDNRHGGSEKEAMQAGQPKADDLRALCAFTVSLIS